MSTDEVGHCVLMVGAVEGPVFYQSDDPAGSFRFDPELTGDLQCFPRGTPDADPTGLFLPRFLGKPRERFGALTHHRRYGSTFRDARLRPLNRWRAGQRAICSGGCMTAGRQEQSAEDEARKVLHVDHPLVG